MSYNPRMIEPYPGDGVCPSKAQIQATYEMSFHAWQSLAMGAPAETRSSELVDNFLSLLNNIPPFRPPVSRKFLILDDPVPRIKHVCEWRTSTDVACDQPSKRVFYDLQIAIRQANKLNFVPSPKKPLCWSKLHLGSPGYSYWLVRGWAFILSARWVETLRDSGEVCFLHQSSVLTIESFWDVIGGHWEACLVRAKGTFYAPWSMVAKKPYARYECGAYFNGKADDIRVELIEASPSPSLAFQILMDFCRSKNIVEEFFAALAIVMMLPDSTRPPSTPPVITASSIFKIHDFPQHRYYELFDNLDKCITLSCSPKGIDSLLCSSFFESSISCNLVGAYLLGAKQVIESIGSDSKSFLRLMSKKSPKFSLLWLAAVQFDQSARLVASSVGGMPPIHLPVASWTNTLQSFLQIWYHSTSGCLDTLPRATEFQYAFMVDPNIPTPFTPSPPFGETALSNTSLLIRSHLMHNHTLFYHRSLCMLDTKDEEQIHSNNQGAMNPVVRLLNVKEAIPARRFDLE